MSNLTAAIGGWITVPHPTIAELMAMCGFDWVVIDAEHGAIGISEIQVLLQAMRAGNPSCVPYVRVPSPYRIFDIPRFLDAGAMGLIVPHVNTAETAAAIVKMVKYPPEGERGVGLSRAQGWGRNFADYMSRANRETRIMAMIEHVEAVENIDSILAVKGIDAILLGPYDLSCSMGLTGQFEHPRMQKAVATVLAACQKAGVMPGYHVVPPDPATVMQRMDEGFRMIAYSLDVVMIEKAISSGLTELRKLADARTPS